MTNQQNDLLPINQVLAGRACTCGHYRLDHEFSEDCSMCWKCGCIEFSPQEKQS